MEKPFRNAWFASCCLDSVCTFPTRLLNMLDWPTRHDEALAFCSSDTDNADPTSQLSGGIASCSQRGLIVLIENRGNMRMILTCWTSPSALPNFRKTEGARRAHSASSDISS